jgi:integrase
MVNYYDKNAERIRSLEKKVLAGKVDPEAAAVRITKLKAKPDYWVRGYNGPREIRRHAQPPHSEAAARREAAKLEMELEGGTYTPEALLKAQYVVILDRYIEKKAGRDPSAVSYANAAKEMIGTVRLVQTHDNVDILVRHFLEDLPPRWPVEKTRWNYVAVLQAAVQGYLDANQKLNIKNPVRTAKKLAEMKRGTRKRNQYPTLEDHRYHLHVASKPPFPAWFHLLIVAYAETAFRGGMIVNGFRWERLHLEHIRGTALPYIEINVSKQKGEGKDDFRQFPISKDLQDALLAYRGAKEAGKVFPVKNIPTKWWKQLFEKCGTQHLHPHDYRRLWKLRYIDHNPKMTAKGMGHATLSMDLDYTILERRELEALYIRSYEEEGP